MPGTASRFIPPKRAPAYPTTTGIRQLAQVLTEPRQRAFRLPSDIVDGEEGVADIITGPRAPRVLSVESGTVIEDAKEWLNGI
jgi:hypothetical protein